MKTVKSILIGFLCWRILLFFPLYVSEKILLFRPNYDYTNIWKFIKPYTPVDNFFLYPWANFDGVHYLLIAGDGYTNNLQFFPLFPMMIKVVSFLFGGTQTFGLIQFFSGFLTVNILFFISLIILYKLFSLDYPKRIVLFSVLFLLFFPTSFYFGSIYSEGLFFLLALLSFYFARRKQWLLSGICAMFLSATRIVGIFMLPALLYEFIKEEKPTNIKSFFKSFPLFFTPLGTIIYGFFNYTKTGDFFYFIKAHTNLGNGRTDSIIIFPQIIFRYFKILLDFPINQYEWWIALLEITTFITISLLLYLAWKRGVRTSYLIFSGLCFLTPVLSGTFSGLPRYSLVLFPIYISLALIKKKSVQITCLILSSILLFILLMFFSKGYFIA